MAEHEINVNSSGLIVNNEVPLHRAWELSITGIVLRLERYGSHCMWDSIKLRRKEEVVYEIKFIPKFSTDGDTSEREEFFFGNSFRKYIGNRFSFVEYIVTIAREERHPEPEEFIGLGLEATLEEQYRYYAKEILGATHQ